MDSLGPPTVEPDAELRVEGNGFPENRRGTLTLEGTAHTPARPPRRVRWELPLVADSRTSISVRADSRRLQEFTEGAAHVTFRGRALIHFTPLVEGRPPLRGSKEGLVLDLFVPAGGAHEDPSPFLAFLGIELTNDLVISKLVADSVADQAGLREGDRLHALDGVRLDSIRDFLPQAHARTSLVEYSRRGYRGKALAQIDRADFQLLDHAMGARALAMLGGVALALLWAARPPRFLLWLFGAKTRARKGRVVWLPGVGHKTQIIAYPIFLAVVLAFWWLLAGFGTGVLGLEFVGALATGGLLLLCSAFLLGGRKSSESGFTLLGAFGSTFIRLLVFLPILIAALARASAAGSLHLSEIAKHQGAWPTDWALFQSPLMFLMGLAYLVALLPLSGRRAPLEGHPGVTGPSLVFSRVSEWAGQLILLALWVALFAGSSLGPAHLGVLGGVLFSTKVALMAHSLAWVRARTGNLRLNESWGFFGVANLIVSVVTSALSVGLVATGLQETHAELLGLFAATLALSLAVLLFVSSQRSWAHMGRRIDPWI